MTKKSTKASSPKPQVTRVDRRNLLRGLGAVGAATALAACSDSSNADCAVVDGGNTLAKKRSLKMVTSWPKNFPGLGTGANRVAARIKEMSGGMIDIKVYAGGELVGALGAFDAVSEGKADMYHSADYYWQGKSQAFNFFAAVPFGMNGHEMSAWIQQGGGQELWDKLSGSFNIKPLMVGNTGVQMGGWYKRDINTLDDFQGLRIRMPGLGGAVMDKLGATPVTKPGSELFQALSQGNIDATEWIGPWNDLAFGFHTIVKNYYYPGIHEPGANLTLGLNLELWDDLSDEEQAIFAAAAAEEHGRSRAEFDAQNARALATLVEEHDVQLKTFSDDILRRMKVVAEEVLTETAKADASTNEIYQSYTSFMKSFKGWNAISEQAYARARDL